MDQLYGLLILYCIIGIGCWYINIYDDSLTAIFKQKMATCLNGCDNCGTYFGIRGKNYYLSAVGAPVNSLVPVENCMFNLWNVSHFIVHSIAGFIAPDYFILDFLIGTSFEALESIMYECQDPTDLVANVSGFCVGKYIRETFYK